jgi:hypothetical protein
LRVEFYMQSWMQTLRNAWAEPVGWALILTGLALATRTLGSCSAGRRGSTLGRPVETPDVSSRAISETGSEWQRLAQIIQTEIVRAETLPGLQARAIDAVEAADDAVSRLLAECRLTVRSAEAADARQEQETVPTSATQPLAA